jgi:hypothetical protein
VLADDLERLTVAMGRRAYLDEFVFRYKRRKTAGVSHRHRQNLA